MAICTRPGCGVDFDPASAASSQGPCVHHPGAPVFHEGSKSWSCCRDRNKPVLEFDEFMLIKGCTTEEAHTNVKQPKATFSKSNGAPGGTDAAAEAGTQAQASSSTTPAAAQAAITPMSSARVAAIQRQNEQRSGTGAKEPAEDKPEEQDPADGEVAQGAKCKRAGCHASFEGGQRERAKETCRYHRGVPIFHEGSKGYACCKRRVLEFDEFLTIEGCSQSESGHLFLGGGGASASAGDEEEAATCRIDHYETPNDVRVTVYAKSVDVDRSVIEIKQEEVDFSLALPALQAGGRARRFKRTLLPYAAVDTSASSFTVSRFKIDLVLVKQQRGESWPALERGDQALGYGLTFGRKLDA